MKNIFKSKRNILIMMFALVVIMGIGFAAYSQQLQIKDTSSIDSDWNVYIKDVSVPDKSSSATGSGAVDKTTNVKADLTTDLKYPGDYVIYKLIVANDGNIDAVLEKINFSMQKEGTVIKYYYSVDDQNTWNEVSKNGENPYNEDLLSKTTDDFYVKVEYDPEKTGTATEDQKSNKLTLEFIYVQKTDGGAIIPDNTASFGGQTVTLAAAGNDGLYVDTYEDGRCIYRGANPDNYISFNDELWRIISIETDGTLKIMKNDSIGNMVFDSNSNMTGSTSWDAPAYLNTYLNGTYYKNISDEYIPKIENGKFRVGAVDVKNLDLADAVLKEKTKIFNCFIALPTATEYVRASININCASVNAYYSNSSCYRNGETHNWMYSIAQSTTYKYMWLLTNYTSNYVYSVYNGRFNPQDYRGNFGVLPTLYLKSDITLSGSGTKDDPFTIN